MIESLRSPMNPHLRRVRKTIGVDVLAFCLFVHRFRDPPSFHVSEVEEYVQARTPAAPGSAARILRELRSRKVIDYRVRRAESRYLLTRIDMPEPRQLELLKVASTLRVR